MAERSARREDQPERVDQKTPRRRAKRAAEAAPKAVEENKIDLPSRPVLSDGSAEGDEVQVLRGETLEISPFDPRTAIAEGLSEVLTPAQIVYLIQEVLAVKKIHRLKTPCDHCGRNISREIEIPDARAVVSGLKDLLSEGFGRTDVAKMEKDMITFQRFTDFSEWEAAGAEGS